MTYQSLAVLEDAAELDTMHRRHVSLTWNVIKFKLMYYYPELVDKEYHAVLTITDKTYDMYRQEYLDLCVKLGVDNLIVDGLAKSGDRVVPGQGMKEVDFERSLVKSALWHVGIETWKAEIEKMKEEKKTAAEKKDDDPEHYYY